MLWDQWTRVSISVVSDISHPIWKLLSYVVTKTYVEGMTRIVYRSHCFSFFSSAVFTSNKLLVVVAELMGNEEDALDIVPVITTALLEEHQLVTGIVVVADIGNHGY